VNRKRPIHALPAGINLADFEWYPAKPKRPLETQAQFLERKRRNKISKLESLQKGWEREELEFLRRKCEALAAVVEADRAWIQRQNELEAELKCVQEYYAQEHAKEEAAADKVRRERYVRLGKEIYRDAARAERRLLLARGVYRGR
jgi:hypothetical protein